MAGKGEDGDKLRPPVQAADDVHPTEESNLNIYIPENRPVQATEEDPKTLEQGLLFRIADWSPVQLSDAFTAAVDEAVELVKWFRTDPHSNVIRDILDALVQHYLDGPLRRKQERPTEELPIIPEGREPSVATVRIRRLVNASLALYVNQFQQNLHNSRDDVRRVLESYQMEIERILIHCLCASLQLEGDLQLAHHLTNLKSITKRVGSLVSAHTEGKVSDLIKGRQLTKEVEDILTTVMSAVSKEVEVLMSINKKQMMSFLNKKRAGVDLTIVAFSPRLTEIERTSREQVSKFLTTFQSHPHTHQALLKLFISEQEKTAEVDRGMYPYLHWLTRMSESYLQLGGWREHLQAHALASFCVAADPENLLLIENVYKTESAAYDGQHPLTFSSICT